MKAVTVVILARNDSETMAINHDLQASSVLNDWPVFTWENREATDEEEKWYNEEYEGQ